MLRNSQTQYGAIARLFHWLIVGMIILQVTLAFIFEGMPRGLEKIAVIGLHKSVGMTILILAILRLLWRFYNPQPALPLHMKVYQRVLSKVTHGGLYLILFALPVSGWIMSSAAKIPVSYFGLFNFPDWVSPDKDLVRLSKDIHESLVYLLLALVSLHIAAVIWHQWIVKDGILYRMLPRLFHPKRRM